MIDESKSYNKNPLDVIYHSDELPFDLSVSNVDTGLLIYAKGYGILSLKGDMDETTYNKYKKEMALVFKHLDKIIKEINGYYKLKKLEISKF